MQIPNSETKKQQMYFNKMLKCLTQFLEGFHNNEDTKHSKTNMISRKLLSQSGMNCENQLLSSLWSSHYILRKSNTKTLPSEALAPTLSPREFQHTSNIPPVPL